tara:strand:- start:252 stop:1718 length:1467 start_codon:yes stop_codon:yes gene_type:complete
MLFNELAFLLFFPVVVGLHFLLPHKHRWALLLVASYFFYMWWEPAYAVLIFSSTVVDYVAGLRMAAKADRRDRRTWLWLSLVVNLGLLFAFKYFNFFSRSLGSVFQWFEQPYSVPDLDVLLPVGISFYTFQTLSYTIDVYRGRLEPEAHFGRFALYVSFFPQLVAGPIERAGNLLPQFRVEQSLEPDNVRQGAFLMLLGMFKKVVVADQLATIVTPVYANPELYSGPILVFATLCFAFQIYCDFSGYSDIAIGAARVLGYRIMVNFHRPYAARDIGEFWGRWHISLSTWFRDYVYLPLGGNRVKRSRWITNIMIVFLVSGMWHGANWTFLVWGGLHGSYYLIRALWRPCRERCLGAIGLRSEGRVWSTMALCLTFVSVCLAWVFFRAADLSTAGTILSGMTEGWGALLEPEILRQQMRSLVVSQYHLMAVLLALAYLQLIEFSHPGRHLEEQVCGRNRWIRWGLYLSLGLLILNLGAIEEVPFVYFQF